MKYFVAFLASLIVYSCIPLQIAPNFEGGKLFAPKKFKRQLPQNYVYVFEDPKDANEFYSYMNAKFQIVYDDATGNIPVEIEDHIYYLTFYEIERNTKTVNLLPMVVDAALNDKGSGPVMESLYESRSGKWFIALTVTDEEMNDALNPEYAHHKNVLAFSEEMRQEYLNTVHYIEVYLKSKPAK